MMIMQRPSHVFTTGGRGDARCWFPCIDIITVKTVWNLNVTVPLGCEAVVSGELLQKELSDDGLWMMYQYKLGVLTPATNIGFAVGLVLCLVFWY